MPYRVQIAPAAERQIRKLEKADRRQVFDKIEKLKSNPRPAGVVKLSGSSADFYRVRTGNFRIIYEIEDKVATVLIVKVGDRKEIYK